MDAATDWVVDGGRYALDFDGSNDYVLINRNTFFDTIEIFTLSAWIKTSSPGGSFRTIVSKDKTFALSLLNSVVATYDWTANASISSGVNVADGKWHLVQVAVNSGATNASAFFVDGVNAGSAFTYSVQTKNLTNDVTIFSALNNANLPVAENVNGQLGELVFHSRRIALTEARQMYQIGRGGMLTPRRRRRAYFAGSGLRRRLLLTGQV